MSTIDLKWEYRSHIPLETRIVQMFPLVASTLDRLSDKSVISMWHINTKEDVAVSEICIINNERVDCLKRFESLCMGVKNFSFFLYLAEKSQSDEKDRFTCVNYRVNIYNDIRLCYKCQSSGHVFCKKMFMWYEWFIIFPPQLKLEYSCDCIFNFYLLMYTILPLDNEMFTNHRREEAVLFALQFRITASPTLGRNSRNTHGCLLSREPPMYDYHDD